MFFFSRFHRLLLAIATLLNFTHFICSSPLLYSKNTVGMFFASGIFKLVVRNDHRQITSILFLSFFCCGKAYLNHQECSCTSGDPPRFLLHFEIYLPRYTRTAAIFSPCGCSRGLRKLFSLREYADCAHFGRLRTPNNFERSFPKSFSRLYLCENTKFQNFYSRIAKLFDSAEFQRSSYPRALP